MSGGLQLFLGLCSKDDIHSWAGAHDLKMSDMHFWGGAHDLKVSGHFRGGVQLLMECLFYEKMTYYCWIGAHGSKGDDHIIEL